jgi:hypothetical protein
MDILSKTLTSELLYFFAIIVGVWLSHSGRPLNLMILMLHKLIGVSTVIFATLAVWELLATRAIDVRILTIISVLGLMIIGIFVSGIILVVSSDSDNRAIRAHNIFTILGIIVTTLTIFLLVGNKI